MVQWLRLHTSTIAGVSLIPGQGTKIPHAPWHSQKEIKKKRKYMTEIKKKKKKKTGETSR